MPRWLYAMAAIGYFLYRLLDEMDGKQARRTGNSSPLGMLFDHGIDAYTTGIVCFMFVKLAQAGSLGYIFVELSCAIFYFCTLQEYYQGGLFLPLGNAVSDGAVITIICLLIPVFFGSDFWITEVIAADALWMGSISLSIINLLTLGTIIFSVFTLFQSFREIFVHKKMVQIQKNDPEFTDRIIDGEEIVHKELASQIFFYFFF